jgi:predicted nuclease of restriction endonuclease-like RecB superfamily
MLQFDHVGPGNDINDVVGDDDLVVGFVKILKRMLIDSLCCPISRRWLRHAVFEKCFQSHDEDNLSQERVGRLDMGTKTPEDDSIERSE